VLLSLIWRSPFPGRTTPVGKIGFSSCQAGSAIWCGLRVSTDGDRQVIDLQRDALLAAGVDTRHLFEDRASGSRDNRPGLAKAFAFVSPGDCLVVWKLDRLGRSLPHLLNTITELQARGVAFRSLTEQMDTTTPQGAFLFHAFAALAQFERSLIQERVQAGLLAARRRGRRCGRPVAIDAENWLRPPERSRAVPARPRCAARSASSAAR
jgi:DNA invertase Pin-like site-specific DNA recombinase